MKKTSLACALATGIAVCAMTAAALADTLEELQGAWVLDGIDCTETFKREGATVTFQDSPTTIKAGIIVNGDRIVGPSSTCTADRVRKEEGRLIARLTCSDSVMVGGRSVAFKILDADHFETFDHFFPNDPTGYHKCPM